MNRIYSAENSENMQNRGESSPRPNKFDFKTYKNNTINSLNEIECFLNDCTRFAKLIKIYKILK